MDYLPTIELLESTHDFPGTYIFKVIGWDRNGFSARVVAAVREELEHEEDPPHKMRYTSSGRHVSVTVEPEVDNPDQVISIYSRLRDMDGLVMMW